jgi:hypothetical protein
MNKPYKAQGKHGFFLTRAATAIMLEDSKTK